MSASPDAFDPYRDWLGIQPHERPLDHYRLLGLARLEGDAARIAAAADERMALVRSFQVGPRRVHTQKLLNELSAARICLLSPPAKAAYDAALHRVGVSPAPVSRSPPPTAPPILPPPPPEPRIEIATDHDEPVEPVEIGPPAPWWRPIATLVMAALIVLATATAWGIIDARRRARRTPIATDVVPGEPLPPEPAPEPPAPEAVVQFQEGNGEVNLAPATAVLDGGAELRTIGTDELLAGFGSPQAAALWKFRLILPGFFRLELKYATAVEIDGAALEASVAGHSKTCELRSTGGSDQFLTDAFTIAIAQSGEHTLALQPAKHPSGDWLILKSVRLIPIGGPAPPVLTP